MLIIMLTSMIDFWYINIYIYNIYNIYIYIYKITNNCNSLTVLNM